MIVAREHKTCSECGETKPIAEFPRNRGRCEPCHKRSRAEYQRGYYAKPKQPCAYRDCAKRAETGGPDALCGMHRRRIQVGKGIGSAESLYGSGDDVSYPGAHTRVLRARGKAANHPCIDCGSPADEWSYRGGALKERAEPKLFRGTLRDVAYSPDPSDYDPRCRSCHRIYDLPVRT